jgi:hypothetical protein
MSAAALAGKNSEKWHQRRSAASNKSAAAQK